MVSEERKLKARVAGLVTALKSKRLRSISQIASCTSDLTLTTSAQDVPGCSLSLGVGTWKVEGIFDFQGNDQSVLASGFCNVDGVNESEEAIYRPNAGAMGRATVFQVWRIVLTVTTTIKLQACKSGAGGTFKAWMTHTQLFAMRTGD